jgi:hypothetical protein
MRRLVVRSLAIAPALLAGCAPLATSPSWAGGGMSVTGPVGVPRFEPDVPVDEVAEDTGETVGARHILVMHLGSQARPEHVVRSREEALGRAREVLEKLKAGADFAALVDTYSDEPGAAERGGDLGVFPRNAMVKPFSDAAFKLQVGELSDVVETRYGFHVIKRTK